MSNEIEWVPRSLNEYADSLNRVVDFDDWSVSTDFFAYIWSLFGPFTVDSFASQCQIQPSVQGFIPNFGVPVRKAWTLSVLIGLARTICWCHLYNFFIQRYAALGEFSLSPSGFH